MTNDVKIAYVIAAHKNPSQTKRLISRLNGTHCDFYLHIDKKVPIKEFQDAINPNFSDRVYFLKRYDASWSEYGMIKAEIQALRTILESGMKYDFIILLSGQDYPIKSNEYIKSFFQEKKEKTFIEHFPMPFAPWPNGGMDRVNRYHFKILNKSFAYPPYKEPKSRSGKLLNWFFSLYFEKRTLPLGMNPFGGEHWWNFNLLTAKYIIDFLDKHPEYYNFHKYSFCADEMFFQTLLMNCKDKAIYDNIVNDDLRYYDWSEGKDSPKTFTIGDLGYLLSSEKLFARKFDINIDSKVLDELDKVILYNFTNK